MIDEEQRNNNKEQLKKFTVAICKPGSSVPQGIIGTGFLVNTNGLVLTCFHVIGDTKYNSYSYDQVDVYFPKANVTKHAKIITEYSRAHKDVAFLTLTESMPTENIAVAKLSKDFDDKDSRI